MSDTCPTARFDHASARRFGHPLARREPPGEPSASRETPMLRAYCQSPLPGRGCVPRGWGLAFDPLRGYVAIDGELPLAALSLSGLRRKLEAARRPRLEPLTPHAVAAGQASKRRLQLGAQGGDPLP